jgi:hypothetical protein
MERHQTGSAQIINNFLIGMDGIRSSHLHHHQGRESSWNPGHVYFRGHASKDVISHNLMTQALFLRGIETWKYVSVARANRADLLPFLTQGGFASPRIDGAMGSFIVHSRSPNS